MFQLKRTRHLGYEDLMREIALIEQQLLRENSAAAMDLMVLEAKLRERFQLYETRTGDKSTASDDTVTLGEELSFEDIQALIPQELPPFPTFEHFEQKRKRRNFKKTLGMAAVFAVVTALGVFGLASILQIILTWLA
ncbi:MAG: hypothetical protein LHV69_04870 [Elusimicrobia bacterium]|nr:hypothetical protein [Candidatus Obscuribacterium magneticum]MCB4756355.1 hypothetical protein [Candidatus Obscuribacterium magneticum]